MPDLMHLSIPEDVFADRPLVTNDGHRLTAEDRLDIIGMPAKFEWAYVTGRYEALGRLFCEDIVMDHAMGEAVGRQAAVEFARSGQVPFLGLRHQFLNGTIFVDAAGEVRLLSYMNVTQVALDPPAAPSLPAIYVHLVLLDTVRREHDGRWRFAQRIFDQLKLADYLGYPADATEALARTQAERQAAPSA